MGTCQNALAIKFQYTLIKHHAQTKKELDKGKLPMDTIYRIGTITMRKSFLVKMWVCGIGLQYFFSGSLLILVLKDFCLSSF